MQEMQIRNHRLRVCLSGLLIVLPSLVFAHQSDEELLNSLHCQPTGTFKSLEALLNDQDAPKQSLILIHNKTKNPLWVTHPSTNPSMHAGWSTPLAVKRWSAIAVDRNHFRIQCIEAMPGAEQQISCRVSIQICEVEGPKFTKTNGGSYWVAENQRLEKLIQKVVQREIKLPSI